ncbi:hypothetical protein [Paramicrobacterium fandaimingii]|uniref:hypothetical protein n=1 Tax=Paramicrobacterium fandaimingii TaxID=2708079 RepID=UPI00141F8606|nr:hypothetical protein [Microbacterium fandaimingii]
MPRDDGKGGGTYGFGKTASYAFSSRGTVLFWSRCRNETGELEHRFIASAFRDSYIERGVQFTGRHWWGLREDETILPIIGRDARLLGQQLFERGFNDDETGTSMLIIEPDLSPESIGLDASESGTHPPDTADTAFEFASLTRAAIRQHLWPKLIPRSDEKLSPMGITLQVSGVDVSLVDDAQGAIGLWAAGLNAIRAVRQNSDTVVSTPQGLPVLVLPVTRYRQTLGHLAVVRRVPALEPPREDDDLDPSVNPKLSRIALMRGQAELVVSTVSWIEQSPLDGLDWLAVYKSADDWDAVYARAEPPAHDAWIANSGGEEGLVVKATRNKVISAIRESLYPEPDNSEAGQQPVHTGSLSRRFASMLPSRPETKAKLISASDGARRRRGKPPRSRHLEVGPSHLLATFEDGSQRQSIEFSVVNSETIAVVTIAVSVIGEEGVHEPLLPSDLDLSWHGAEKSGPAQALVAGDRPVSVEFTGTARRALRIDLSAEGQDGGP